MTRKIISLLVACIMVISVFGLSVFAEGEENVEDPKIVNFSGTDLNNARIFDEEDMSVCVASFSAAVRNISVRLAKMGTDPGAIEWALYAFEKDYETSILRDAIKQGSFEVNSDGYYDITWEEEPLAAGVYVILFYNAVGRTGLRYNGAYEGQYVIENDIYTPDNSVKMIVTYDTVPETPYGAIEKPIIDEENDIYPGGVMFFDEDGADSWFKAMSNFTENSIVDGYLQIKIAAEAKDPYLPIYARADVSDLDAQEYPVLLMKVRKSAGTPATGQFFFNTSEFKGWSAKGSVSFSYADTTDWQLVVVNFGSNTNFKGRMVSFRFDPFSTVESESTVDIAWMAFFDSVASATAFDGDFDKLYATPTPDPNATPTPTPVPTETPKATTAPTQVPLDATRVPATTNNDKGCGSSSAVAQVMLVLGAALIIKKKK